MPAPTLQEALIGGFAFFVPEGTVLGGQTISATVKPADSPGTNWTNNTLGTVKAFEFGEEKTDASYMAPLQSGGHTKINRSFVTQDYVTLETREMGELVWRLTAGFTAAINEGTAQTPGLLLDRKIVGWLRLQGRALTGIDRFRQDWWCEVRLEGKKKFEDKVVESSLRFTLIPGPAGNSTNFPAQS